MATKLNKPTTCQCGCSGTPKSGRYLPGHDAKHKANLVKAALSGSKRATRKLETLGWGKFLELKRTTLSASPAKAAAKAL